MKKSRGILSLILVAALSVLLGVTTIRGLDSEGMGAAKNAVTLPAIPKSTYSRAVDSAFFEGFDPS